MTFGIPEAQFAGDFPIAFGPAAAGVEKAYKTFPAHAMRLFPRAGSAPAGSGSLLAATDLRQRGSCRKGRRGPRIGGNGCAEEL